MRAAPFPGPTSDQTAQPGSFGRPGALRVVPISGETPAGRRRRLDASRRGSRAVSEAFAGAVTRRSYSQLVGIHLKTHNRWEDEGVVAPKLETIMSSPTRVFSQRDVESGRRLIAILRDEPGCYSLIEAARRAREG